MHGADVLAAATAPADFLRPLRGRDWSHGVPGLDFTVASVVAHASRAPLLYAVYLTGGPASEAAFELRVRPSAEPARLLASLRTAAALCAMTVDQFPASARGFHPYGIADPSGFAAMACDEILVHTHDAASGLDEWFTPSEDPVRRVLARLFPCQQPTPDAWTALLWVNGRIDLPGMPRRRRWRWHCAPLAEWDGTVPAA